MGNITPCITCQYRYVVHEYEKIGHARGYRPEVCIPRECCRKNMKGKRTPEFCEAYTLMIEEETDDDDDWGCEEDMEDEMESETARDTNDEDYIRRKDVIKLIEDIKCDPTVPKNYGTLLDILRQVRILPAVKV